MDDRGGALGRPLTPLRFTFPGRTRNLGIFLLTEEGARASAFKRSQLRVEDGTAVQKQLFTPLPDSGSKQVKPPGTTHTGKHQGQA
jgi:hypothetical protein